MKMNMGGTAWKCERSILVDGVRRNGKEEREGGKRRDEGLEGICKEKMKKEGRGKNMKECGRGVKQEKKNTEK